MPDNGENGALLNLESMYPGRFARSLHSLAPLAPLARYARSLALVLRAPLAPLARYARSLALVLRAPRGGATLSHSLRSLAPLARSPLCYALPSLRSLAPLARSPLCYARSSAPARSPLALLGGRAGAAGLPRRYAPPPPRRVALPLRGSLVRPAPLRLAPWRPLSLRGVRVSPRAPPVPRGHPRPCVGRGLRPPPPSSPLLGATRPLSPSLSALGVRVRPARHAPTHSP